MAALVVLAVIVALSAVLFGVFVRTCIGIRRTDRFGSRRSEPHMPRHGPSLAYAARWDDDRPAFA